MNTYLQNNLLLILTSKTHEGYKQLIVH